MRFIQIPTLLIFGMLVSTLAFPSDEPMDNDNEEQLTTPEPTQEITPEPVQEITPEPVQETTPEPVKEVTPEPVQEITQEPVQETTPATVASPILTAADGLNAVLTTKTKLITQVPEAINNVTTDTIKEIALIPEKAKTIITDAVKLSPLDMTTPSILNPNKRVLFKSKAMTVDNTNEKDTGVISLESVLSDVKEQFQVLNNMLASKQSTNGGGIGDEGGYNNEMAQQVRDNIMQLLININNTDTEEEKKKMSLNDTISSNFLTSLVDYIQTQPQMSSTVVFAISFVVISVVSACVNCIFLLVFKLSRKLRKSLLGTFYTDLRRSFNPADNIPLYHNV